MKLPDQRSLVPDLTLFVRAGKMYLRAGGYDQDLGIPPQCEIVPGTVTTPKMRFAPLMLDEEPPA